MKIGVLSKIGIYYNKHSILGMIVVTGVFLSVTHNIVGR